MPPGAPVNFALIDACLRRRAEKGLLGALQLNTRGKFCFHRSGNPQRTGLVACRADSARRRV